MKDLFPDIPVLMSGRLCLKRLEGQDADSLAVLDSLATAPVDGSFRPLTAQVISSIRVETYEVEYEPVTIDRKE